MKTLYRPVLGRLVHIYIYGLYYIRLYSIWIIYSRIPPPTPLPQGVFGLSDGGALIETVASYATPSGAEINERGITPDEDHVFLTDLFGASFLDGDIKAAKITPPVCDDGGSGGARAAPVGGGGVVVGGGGVPNRPADTL